MQSNYSLTIVENELAAIVATQGSNARDFAALVKENEETLDAMKVRFFEYVNTPLVSCHKKSLYLPITSPISLIIPKVKPTRNICSRTCQKHHASR